MSRDSLAANRADFDVTSIARVAIYPYSVREMFGCQGLSHLFDNSPLSKELRGVLPCAYRISRAVHSSKAEWESHRGLSGNGLEAHDAAAFPHR